MMGNKITAWAKDIINGLQKYNYTDFIMRNGRRFKDEFIKTLMVLFSAFVIFSLLRYLFVGSVLTEARILKQLKSAIPKIGLPYEIIKADLKGLSTESIILYAKNEDLFDVNPHEKGWIYPKIIIFDKKDKDPLVSFISQADAYKIAFEVSPQTKYGILLADELLQFQKENNPFFVLCESVPGHSAAVFCGMIKWNLWDGYTIEPLVSTNSGSYNLHLDQGTDITGGPSKEYIYFQPEYSERTINKPTVSFSHLFAKDAWCFLEDGKVFVYEATIYDNRLMPQRDYMSYNDYTDDIIRFVYRLNDNLDYQLKEAKRMKNNYVDSFSCIQD